MGTSWLEEVEQMKLVLSTSSLVFKCLWELNPNMAKVIWNWKRKTNNPWRRPYHL
jgi:hypothetical protein